MSRAVYRVETVEKMFVATNERTARVDKEPERSGLQSGVLLRRGRSEKDGFRIFRGEMKNEKRQRKSPVALY